MGKDRDLFRAIVISGAALVGGVGCDDDNTELADAGVDQAMAQDQGTDQAKPNTDGMPLIL
jgi:hypothetical protein